MAIFFPNYDLLPNWLITVEKTAQQEISHLFLEWTALLQYHTESARLKEEKK